MKNLKEEYFEWIYDIVCDRSEFEILSYTKLLHKLHDTPFKSILGRDWNRARDGVELRYEFGRVNGYSEEDIARYLDRTAADECSVLEMIVALAMRCETNIMWDYAYGDRTRQWIWVMLKNLQIGYMSDARYDEKDAEEKINRFLDRKYEANGEGSLFGQVTTWEDVRKIEIWYQAQNYFNKFI